MLYVVSKIIRHGPWISPDGVLFPKAYRGLSQQLSPVYALELTSTMSLL